MKKNYLLVLLFLIGFCNLALAQDRKVSGKVTSATDGLGFPGVNVVLKGTTNGTVTDLNGNYVLSIPSQGGTLEFSAVGYVSQAVAIGNQSVINIVLAEDVKQLSEIVVVGYGVQEKKELTGSVTSVTAKDIADAPILGVEQALQGRAAGVQITQNSGTPGSGIAVRVRGAASLGASNEPLYVVDGVPINAGSYAAIGVGNQQTNALADLNPGDIESMEILKDAAAAAIYGSRASNGVVIITTKRGANQKTKINFGHYTGMQTAWKQLPTISGAEQTKLLQEMLQNRFPRNADGTIPGGWASYEDYAAWQFNPQNTRARNANNEWAVNPNTVEARNLEFFKDPSKAPSTNWQDHIFRTAPISNYDLSASGGNEKTKFLVSGTLFDQKGIVIGSGFKRLSGRLNLDNQVTQKLKIGTSIGVSRSFNNRIQNDNNINGVISTAVLMASDIPARFSNGAYGRDAASSVENPIAAALEPTLDVVSGRVLGNVFAEYELIPGLAFRTSMGLDYLSFKEDQFIPTTTNTGAGSRGTGRSSYRQEVNTVFDNILTYRKTIAQNHSINALLGTSVQESQFESLYAEATNFPGNSIKRLSAGSVKAQATSGGSSWGLVSYFSRVNYSFKGKYLLSGSVRVDGSSRFGANNRYGIFPAGSVGYRISEEQFMKDLNLVSDLKVRASYGLTGNQEMFNGNFASRGLVNAGANYNLQSGLIPGQLANPNLTWEQTAQGNVGLDVGVLQDRIYLSVDAYHKETEGLLLARPLVGSSGYTSIQENIGRMLNKGMEFGLTTTNVSTDKVSWKTNFNIAFNQNKILELSGNPYASGFASWVQVGQPVGAFRGYRVEKIFQNQAEIDAANEAAKAKTGRPSAVYQAALTRAGDIKFKDLNGDGVITADDQEILGSAQPKVFGGITNTVNFYGFDLSVFMQYSYGNMIYNNTKAFSEGMNGVFGQTAGVLNRWTPENTNTDIPRAVLGDPNNNRRTSDRFLEDGSYIRVKNVSLGYKLPESVVKLAHLSSARVYVASQNLFTFTKYSGFDPEVNTFSGSNTALGTDFLVYPQARTFTVGVNIGL